MKTQTTITEITHEDLVNLFSTSFYGNSYMGFEYDTTLADVERYGIVKDDCREDVAAKILLGGGEVYVTDYDAEGVAYGKLKHDISDDEYENVTYTLTLHDILKGLANAADGTFNDNGNENEKECGMRCFQQFANDDGSWDMYDAYNLMQIIVFNEIIYG